MSPGKFEGFNTSSTSIALRWDPIPERNVAGVLRNFYIAYRELDTDDNTTRTIAVPLANLSFVLTNLRKYTNYSLEIKGATKFLGRPTEPIIITTDEDGNAVFCLFSCLVVYLHQPISRRSSLRSWRFWLTGKLGTRAKTSGEAGGKWGESNEKPAAKPLINAASP